MKFFETLVRVHRAIEGAPFTGLKPALAAEPIVAKADKAIETRSLDTLTAEMSKHLVKGVNERFSIVLEAKKHKDESVEAGRAYVAAYVQFMHYVEGIHKALIGISAQHCEEGIAKEGHRHKH